nr:hypothetical protein [Tanacetum cinerariifolium]
MNNWASALASNYSPPLEDSLLAQTDDIAMFMDWFCKRRGIIELKPQDLEGLAFEIVKVFHPDAWSIESGLRMIKGEVKSLWKKNTSIEQETHDLDMENKHMKNLKASYGVTIMQELRRKEGSFKNTYSKLSGRGLSSRFVRGRKEGSFKNTYSKLSGRGLSSRFVGALTSSTNRNKQDRPNSKFDIGIIQYRKYALLYDMVDLRVSRIKEDYQSIKDDIPLVSVYTSRNVLVRGMLIPDAFLTKAICATDDLRSDDRERDEVAEATIISLTLHKTALAAKAQENIAKVQEKQTRRRLKIWLKVTKMKNHMQIEKEKKDEEIENKKKDDNIEKTDKVVNKKDIVDDVTGSMGIRKEQKQTPIPSPIRSPMNVSSSDKIVHEELTATVSPRSATTSNDSSTIKHKK